MIHILGGSKVGLNLNHVLAKDGIESCYYYFDGEFGVGRNGGRPFFGEWHGCDRVPKGDRIILSSETALNHLSPADQGHFSLLNYLRNKRNLGKISEEIGLDSVPTLCPADEERFPIVAKPKDTHVRVPFKIRKIRSKQELLSLEEIWDDCIFQPFLGLPDFRQIAIAGFFTGVPASLICVEQVNQHPIGTSSHVTLVRDLLDDLRIKVADYLNRIDFKGFIELEFKLSKKDGSAYLIDINPRLWGWSYFYIAGVVNLGEVINDQQVPEMNVRSSWVNPPRYVLSLMHGRFSLPTMKEVFLNEVSYEPLFVLRRLKS